MIEVSVHDESKEDGQKVVVCNTQVRNCSSRVKHIAESTIWPRGGGGVKGGGGKWLK